MFRGSRVPRGRFEDRCDGAGSEADGAKPSVNRALARQQPVPRVLVCKSESVWVKLLSSGLRIEKARRWLGRFCPAYRTEVLFGISLLPKRKFFIQSLLRRFVLRGCFGGGCG